MKTKTISMIVLLLLVLMTVGCAKDAEEVEKVEELKEVVMERPKEIPMPVFPDNPFGIIEAEDRPGPELEDQDNDIISIRMFQFGIDPEVIEVEKDQRVILIVTSADVGHGFALPDFGINEKVPPEESIRIEFIADMEGEFEYFESIYSGKGWKEMKGKIIVK